MTFKNFEIRKPAYIGEIPEKYKYDWDIVKWCEYSPREVIDGRTGEKRISTRSCYTIGTLRWNREERYFTFESCGTRYLEDREDGLEEFILDFVRTMEDYGNACENY